MESALERAMRSVGDPGAVVTQHAVSGGCISDARYIETDSDRYFLKTNTHNFFQAEAHGLDLLQATQSLGVPAVLAVDVDYILLAWIERTSDPDAHALGTGLAHLHRHTDTAYGLERDNYIGATPQRNRKHTEWPRFFAEERLIPQAKLAQTKGSWSTQRERRLLRVLSRLEELLPASPPASLLHGDLWSGNVMGGKAGRPYIFDPAVYYGHRETDIAFSRLFGGFPPAFYDAYQHTWPIEPGWEERAEIYNLYHLLNHLNLFGEGYGHDVDRILQRFGS
jgi:protein-ribulosamine 3-kinase